MGTGWGGHVLPLCHLCCRILCPVRVTPAQGSPWSPPVVQGQAAQRMWAVGHHDIHGTACGWRASWGPWEQSGVSSLAGSQPCLSGPQHEGCRIGPRQVCCAQSRQGCLEEVPGYWKEVPPHLLGQGHLGNGACRCHRMGIPGEERFALPGLGHGQGGRGHGEGPGGMVWRWAFRALGSLCHLHLGWWGGMVGRDGFLQGLWPHRGAGYP